MPSIRFRLGEDGRLYMLEVNALPSLERGSSTFAAAARNFGSTSSGRSATSSVVLASLFVILADIVLVRFILVFFPS